MLSYLRANIFRVRLRHRLTQLIATALANHALEQTGRQGRRGQCGRIRGTRRLAKNRYVVRISTKRFYVLLHPLKRRDLIQDRIVAGDTGVRLCRQTGMTHETHHADAIIDADKNDTPRRQPIAVIIGLI